MMVGIWLESEKAACAILS